MKKVYLMLGSVVFALLLNAQGISMQLKLQLEKMEAEEAFKHASVSFLVVDGLTGKTVYASNEELALAPASTQKIFTSIAAYELMGKNFNYGTNLAYVGKIEDSLLRGDLVIVGSGDPTLGSWRWKNGRDELVLRLWTDAVRNKGISRIHGNIRFVNVLESKGSPIPGGWIWDDIGNYYGTGSWGFNWRENQYDLVLQSGDSVGSAVRVLSSKPAYVLQRSFHNELVAAAKGTGDNAYIYFPISPGAPFLLRGTIPAGEKNFTISGSSPDPSADFVQEWKKLWGSAMKTVTHKGLDLQKSKSILAWVSPPLDSMNYWFLKKSINLYGEAFLKTMALVKKEEFSTEKGIEVLQEFWKKNGIDEGSMQVLDGSGLSPQNRVTTRALVTALLYARDRPWFASFHHSLPVINQLRMKSGSIGGARSYAGYHTSTSGSSYIFAFIVNNYSGSSTKVVRMMWEVLDVMK